MSLAEAVKIMQGKVNKSKNETLFCKSLHHANMLINKPDDRKYNILRLFVTISRTRLLDENGATLYDRQLSEILLTEIE